MEKSLKKYQDAYKKLNENYQEIKEEKRKIEEEIQVVKNSVKENTKKGKLTSLLKMSDTDKLTKLLASKEIIDLQLESMREVLAQNDNEAVKAALYYLDRVEQEINKESEEYASQREKAQKLIEEGQALARKYSHMSQISASNIRANQAKHNLYGVLAQRMTEEDKRDLSSGIISIQKIRDVLTR